MRNPQPHLFVSPIKNPISLRPWGEVPFSGVHCKEGRERRENLGKNRRNSALVIQTALQREHPESMTSGDLKVIFDHTNVRGGFRLSAYFTVTVTLDLCPIEHENT